MGYGISSTQHAQSQMTMSVHSIQFLPLPLDEMATTVKVIIVYRLTETNFDVIQQVMLVVHVFDLLKET